ncbi:MAG: TonB-linked SusC/RagA family outer membrane protein [Cognaticolwellia sp.]|jgi:TonB-linked SusC/RagA family outer membrane protein
MKKSILFLTLFVFSINFAMAQKTIKGIVSDEFESLIGATIQIKGTGIGVATDFDGSYTVKVPNAETVLIFSYIGLETQEIIVGTQTTIDVILKENTSVLDEVIVIGYGTQKRSNISGSVGVITAEEITETPVLRVEQALQGRTAGVQIAQNSGAPGSALTVRIRGIGTINNSDPLYIVDGVPVGGIDYLNPNDIESVNVLKDAASAAIYGARGANGVVLITTKGGKRNQEGKISYESYYGIQSPWKKINLLNAEEYAILSNEARINSGIAPLPEFSNPSVLGEGTDWLGAIFQDAPMTNHQVGITGGSEKSAYALSANFFSQDGIVGGEKSNFERVTVRFNANTDIKSWLKVGNNLSFTSITKNSLPENNEFTTPLVRALNMDPVTPIYKADGTYAYSRYADTDIVNPLNAIEQTNNTWNSNRLVGSVYGEAQIMEGLTFKSTYSMDVTFAEQNGFAPRFDLSNDTTLADAPAGERSLINTVSIGNNIWTNWQWENLATYNKTSGDHVIVANLGNTVLKNRHDYNGGANTNLPSNNVADAYISNTIDPISSMSSYSGATESAMISFFTRVNYEYKDKYLGSVTFRADGSSRFGANKRFGFFPSASFAWVTSREDFWNYDAISFFKVRTSWGQNGSDQIGNYGFTSVVSNGQNYAFGPGQTIRNGAIALSPGNEDLQWETSTQTNVGVDLEFLDGIVSFTADYYIKNTSDMLYAAPIPLHVGAAFPPTQNIGEVNNSGLELSVNHRNTLGEFKYRVGGNIAFVNTEVVYLGEGGEPISTGRVQSANANVSRTEVGKPIAGFYGYVTDGIFQNGEEVAAHAFQSSETQPGDIRFKDLNGDNIINEADQDYIGNATPAFTYGTNFSVDFRSFDFSLFLLGSYGNDIYNATVRYDFTYVNRPASELNRWTGEGSTNENPRVSLTDPNQNARVSDRFVEDGSFMRIKNVQLGYTLPRNISNRLKIDKFRVYVSAQNLFTVTNYSGLDPEIGALSALEIGIDRGFYPQARTFLGGVQLAF